MPSPLDSLFRGYSPLEVAVEIAFIWFGVWLVFRFLRGTRGAGVIKGFVVVVVTLAIGVRVLAEIGGNLLGGDGFGRIRFLADGLLYFLAFALVVAFQPEIRQAMSQVGSRIGQGGFFRRFQPVVDEDIAGEITEAADFLSRNRFGALVVVERTVPLGKLSTGGTELDAKVTAALLESIFWPNNPLHDLATVIRNGRIWGCGIQLPLAEEGSVPAHLGARHRAALGITMDTDCVVLIVSEETGSIRLAHAGALSAPIPRDEVRARLLELLSSGPVAAKPASAPPEGETS